MPPSLSSWSHPPPPRRSSGGYLSDVAADVCLELETRRGRGRDGIGTGPGSLEGLTPRLFPAEEPVPTITIGGGKGKAVMARLKVSGADVSRKRSEKIRLKSGWDFLFR